MRSLRLGLRAFRRLSWAERGLFLEAALVLAAVSLCVRLAPFRLVMRLAGWPLGSRPRDGDQLELLRRVRWSILAAAARAPWRAVCLHQSLAAQILLRRRGLPSVLYYGARQDKAEGLQAHAWVKLEEVDVVGGEAAPDFAVLAIFPANAVSAGPA